MADRIEWFDCNIPAVTRASAPKIFNLSFYQGTVVQIDVKVPPGPSGTVGFFIIAGGSQFIPRTPGSYITPDNDDFHWPIENAINSGSWGLSAFNSDYWPHLIQVSFQVNEITPSPMSSFSLPVSV